MRKALERFSAAVLVLTLAFGCAPAEAEEVQGLKLWFPVKPELNMVSAALDACPYEGEDQSIPGLMNALLAGPPAEAVELTGFIPAGTRVLSWSLEDKVADVELSAAYAELVGVDLTLADYCVTLTLTQLEGVDGVRITVNGGGQSYRERGVLYPEDALFSGAEEAPVEISAALYFRREGGDTLGYELRKLRLTEGSVPAKVVLSALIAGPEEQGLVPLLPAELSVHSVWVEEGVCTADLSAQLLEVPPKERALAVSSIEETLRSLESVEQVQILIEGEPVEGLEERDLPKPHRSAAKPEAGPSQPPENGAEPTPKNKGETNHEF